MSEYERIEYCEVTIRDGQATALYKWNNLNVAGAETYDEDMTEWSDSEILDYVGEMLDVPKDQRSVITIVRE